MIDRQPFGRTGHDSSRIIFGAAALWGFADDGEVAHILDLLLEHGINHIDTAASYGRSERRVGAWMEHRRDDFFLATKTNERTAEGAQRQLEKSLERLRVKNVDLLQLHNLVDEQEWETAMAPGGALEYAIAARERRLIRFIGVTGHGVEVARMHLRSLERFPFDSVLLPYNYVMMRNPSYAADFERLYDECARRGIAMQTIKGITLGPWAEGAERTTTTWYEPLSEEADIDRAVGWVLGRAGVFLNTAGDVNLLPRIIDAAERHVPQPPDTEMDALVERRAMSPLFV
jgi:aryl-alcohol dehydrogenase-like predicted oxidoreductase